MVPLSPDPPAGGSLPAARRPADDPAPQAVPGALRALFAQVGAVEARLLRTIDHRVGAPARPDSSAPAAPADGDPRVYLAELLSPLQRIEARLAALEERSGPPDAAPGEPFAELDALLTRLERIEAALEGLGSESDRPGLPEAEARLKGIEDRLCALHEALASPPGATGAVPPTEGAPAKDAGALATLKCDFSLLVHTINGHLEESRDRSRTIEEAIAQLLALAPPSPSPAPEIPADA